MSGFGVAAARLGAPDTNLLSYSGSCVVIDPKGENAKATGRQRATAANSVDRAGPMGSRPADSRAHGHRRLGA